MPGSGAYCTLDSALYMLFAVYIAVCIVSPSQEIGLGKHLRNDLFCVEWDAIPQLSQSICTCCKHRDEPFSVLTSPGILLIFNLPHCSVNMNKTKVMISGER